MSNETTDQTISQVTSQVQGDIALAAQAVKLATARDYPGLFKLLIENESTLRNQAKEVEAVIPAVKAGWKTSEFWMIAIFMVINVIFALKGMPLPLVDDITVGSLVAGYAASRHSIKTKGQ